MSRMNYVDETIGNDVTAGSRLFKFRRNSHYGNAFGNYCGGYGGGEMFAPQIKPTRPIPSMGPTGPLVPTRLIRPMWQMRPNDYCVGSTPPLGWGPAPPELLYHPRAKPTAEKTIEFLICCGISKDNVKNLPKQLLQMYQPEHCRLCADDFNSLVTSRLHYISKSHMNNQKNWLTRYNSLHTSEPPFKPRDQYCELCDIQITSKQHGELHYAGRPHRATVAGRKEPRNKVLTLANKQYRLEKLIRREKKYLKPIDEVARAAALEKAKEAKVIPPDLYCKICKTAVTCSDQMTTHLNGKKHLRREKKHILQMMKRGEVDESRTNESAESNAKGGKGKTARLKRAARETNKQQGDLNQEKHEKSREET